MARNRFRSVNRPPPTDFPAYPRLIGSVSSLDQDDPSATRVGPTATIVTTGLQGPYNVGDLVVVHVFYRGNPITISVSTTGGQNWIKCAQHLATNNTQSVFFCRFNGTWDANPVFTVGSGTESMIAVMSVWRSLNPNARWELDQAPQLGSAAGTGFTISGVTPNSQNTVAIAAVSSIDDNNWINTTPGRWTWLAKNSYRTQGGTDGSMAIVGLSQLEKDATGPVTLTQTLLGADAGITTVLVFRNAEDVGIGARPAISRVPAGRGGRRQRFVRGLEAFTDATPASPDITVALTGIQVVVSAGTLVPNFDIPLVGSSVTASAGTLVPLFSIPLTGSSVTGSAGTITYSVSSDLTIALTGIAVVSSAGTLTPTFGIPLVGQSVTASAGTLVVSLSLGITGSAGTSSAGTIVPVMAVPLVGQAVTASAGTITPTFGIPLVGQAVTASAGTVTYTVGSDLTIALSGIEVTVTAGTLTYVAQGGEAVSTGAGRSKRRRRYTVVIDGAEFEVENQQHAVELLSRAKELAQVEAARVAEAAVPVKALRKTGKKPIALQTPKISSPDSELSRIITEARNSINEIYRNAALQAELSYLMAKQQEQDDEEAIMLLM